MIHIVIYSYIGGTDSDISLPGGRNFGTSDGSTDTQKWCPPKKPKNLKTPPPPQGASGGLRIFLGVNIYFFVRINHL